MLSRTILPAFARLLSLLVPSKYWYPCAYAVCGHLAALLRLFDRDTGSHSFEQARFLNRVLAKLTRDGRRFPVPWRWDGPSESVVRSALSDGRGVVFFSAHLPLVKVAVGALMQKGLGPDVPIAARPDPDGCLPIWGLDQRLPALQTGAGVLLKARTVLRKGGSVLLLVDTRTGEYSPNIFKLAGSTGAAAICFSAELEPDGMIAVRFFAPPHPDCRDAEQIAANLAALDRELQRISGRKQPDAFDRIPASRLT